MTYYSGPDAGDGHIPQPLTLKVHGQALCQDAHSHLTHGIRRLAAEEATVDGRAHDDDPPAGAEMRQRGLDGSVEAIGIHALHELEAPQRRGCDGGPEDGARVIDEHVEAVVGLAPGGTTC